MKFKFSSALEKIVRHQLSITPQYRKFLQKRFSNLADKEKSILDQLAIWILEIHRDELDEICLGYSFLTEILKDEEFYFRRNNKYRRSTEEQCQHEIYNNLEYMKKYINGLLLSQIFWSNHTGIFEYYVNCFLSLSNKGDRILEIGPGHGLFLAVAAKNSSFSSINGWDISQSSIDTTAKALRQIGVSANLSLCNVMDRYESIRQFDMIIMSELLEHLKNPKELLSLMFNAMKPSAHLFISFPINSPAPDHIYLLREIEEVEMIVKNAGFYIDSKISLPATNVSLNRAIKKNLTISVGLIAKKFR